MKVEWRAMPFRGRPLRITDRVESRSVAGLFAEVGADKASWCFESVARTAHRPWGLQSAVGSEHHRAAEIVGTANRSMDAMPAA
jgi:hypothetical protein